MEKWKIIEDFEDYCISDLGRIKSFKFKKEKILKGSFSHGYPIIMLSKKGQKKTFVIHILVAKIFLDYKNDNKKIVIDHINNIRTDNRLINLQIITQRQNLSKDKKGSSIYTGVCWIKQKNKWGSSITINNYRYHLGYFKNEYDAHLSYQNKLNQI